MNTGKWRESSSEPESMEESIPAQWSLVQASALGSSHESTGLCLQDAHLTRVGTGPDGSPYLITVVSDGAGSSAYSDEGATQACRFFCEKFASVASTASGAAGLVADDIKAWMAEFQAQIQELAAERGSAPREFASTLVAALVCDSVAVFAQVGDGVIVVADEEVGDFAWIFWPDRGAYANETSFLTDLSAPESLRFEVTGRQIRQVALMTDGLQSLALNYADRSAHAPFFRPMFRAMDAAWQAGVHQQLCNDLVLLLNSKGVRSRTDDDLTLVLACRAPPHLNNHPAS